MVLVKRDADTLGNRADMHVALIDVPPALALGIAAAGEGGHSVIEARWTYIDKPLGLEGWPQTTANSNIVYKTRSYIRTAKCLKNQMISHITA
jgi:hypothetical protein